MADRIQITFHWMVKPGRADLPFGSLQDFCDHAQHVLAERFAHYNAELAIAVTDDHGEMAVLELVWDVDLDMVPGGYHDPQDHLRHARCHLHEGMRLFSSRLRAQPVMRHPRENDVDGATGLVEWDAGYRDRCYSDFVKRMEAEAA